MSDKCVRPQNDGKCIRTKAKMLAIAVLNSARSLEVNELAYEVLEATRDE